MTRQTKVGTGIAGIVIGLIALVLSLLQLNNDDTRSAAQAGMGVGAVVILVGSGLLVSGLRRPKVNRPKDSPTIAVNPMAEAPDRTIGLNLNYGDVVLNRGNDRASKGNFDGAIEDYTEAIKLKPDNHAIYRNRGSARLFKGDVDGAISDYSESIKLNPDFADTYLNRGTALVKSGNQQSAAQDFQKALALDPNGNTGRKAQEALASLGQ